MAPELRAAESGQTIERFLNLRSLEMNNLVPVLAISPLRQRLIDDMTMRRFSRETQRNYIRDVVG